MQHIECTEGDTDAFAIGLELFDVIEDHCVKIRIIFSASCSRSHAGSGV